MDEEQLVKEIAGRTGDLDMKSAIQIAKLVSIAPEERLPMILDVFSQAGLDIAGLEELETWKEARANQKMVGDIDEFLSGITAKYEPHNGEYRIPVSDFDAYCKAKKVKSRLMRKALAELLLIRTGNVLGKTEYSCVIYNHEYRLTERCICIKEKWRSILAEG